MSDEKATTHTSATSAQPEEKRILGMDRTRFKIFLGALIVIAIVVFILQNLETSKIRFFFTLEMPRIILYTGLFGAGALFGWIIKSLSLRWKK